MARIRTIKPSFWVSSQVVECSIPARLLFIGLWTFCDDQGVHPANEKSLKMEVFPGDDIPSDEIRRYIGELSANGLITFFEASGVEYWYVTGWAHQKIERPNNRHPNPLEYQHSPTSRRQVADKSPSCQPRKGRERIVIVQESNIKPPTPLNVDNSVDNVGKVESVGFENSLVDRKSFRLSPNTLTEEVLINARKKAPMWDIYHLKSVFETSVQDGKHPVPTNEAGAFIAWCGKYTKGRKP